MNEWVAAAIAVGAGFVLGGIARTIVDRALSKESRPEALRNSASALAGLVFSAVLISGLIVALGIVDPSSLEQMPEDLVAFVPKALSAAILVIGGNVLAAFATVGVRSSLTGAKPAMVRRIATVVKVAILGAACLLAASQLGVDTTILNLAAAALFFSIGAAFALLSGLGGRSVSAEIAAGRAVRRMIGEGDRLEVAGELGIVDAIHPAAIELRRPDGTVSLVPHSIVLGEPTHVMRRPVEPGPPPAPAD